MKTTIDQHISDLLYYHECVVVPGFGAFLTRYFSAEVHSATNMLRPPSKRVAFNARINENDGLLAKHVAKVEGVDYQKAVESISISVRSWQRILRSGKKINLHGVGRLFLDEEGLLQFNPAHDINYNIKSYGLNIFRATAMEREQKIKRSVNRAIENHKKPKGKALKSKPDGKNNKNWIKWAAVLGPVAAVMLVGSYMYTQERGSFDNAAGYISSVFTGSENNANSEAAMGDSIRAGENSDLADDKTSLDSSYRAGEDVYTNTEMDEEYNSSLYNVKESPEGAPKETTADKKSESPASMASTAAESQNTAAAQPAYQVIVGSFGNEDNARQYVSSLKSKGFEAYLSGNFGMYQRVAIGRYNSQTEAMQELQRIRNEVNYNAWLNDN